MRCALASRLRSLIGPEVLEVLCYGKAGLFNFSPLWRFSLSVGLNIAAVGRTVGGRCDESAFV